MHHCLDSLTPRLLLRALVFAFLLPLAGPAVEARQGTVPVGPRRDPEAERIREEQKREMQLRGPGEEAARPKDESAVRAAVKKLNEDFKRVQVIRNEVARALVSGGALDYGRISEQAAEVRKRALRMQAYLALRGAEDEKAQTPAPQLEGAQMKDALVRLCRRIDSFVASPRFKSPEVVDVSGDEKAGRDLREIIFLSTAVRESADRLSREGAGGKHDGP